MQGFASPLFEMLVFSGVSMGMTFGVRRLRSQHPQLDSRFAPLPDLPATELRSDVCGA